MDINVLQNRLRKFASERQWEPFHTPKNLATALMVEAAELMELFQWKTPEESQAVKTDATLRARVGEEVADVFLYLIQLADHSGVDLGEAVEDKLAKNAIKYPLAAAKTASQEHEPKVHHTHVLIDWENVQPKDADIRALVPDVTDVWIFHGPNQKKVAQNQVSFGDALTLVPISRTGNNALDFHLSYYVGYISSRNPNARFVVISNDKGYGPMLEHAKELGFAASQIGFGAPKSPAKKVVAKKAATKQVSTAKAPAKKAAAKKAVPAKKAPSAVSGPAAVPVKKSPASKKTNSKVDVSGATTAEPQGKKPTPTKKTPTAKAKTAKPSKSTSTSVGGIEAGADKAYEHVLASLRKSKNKPARQARLYGVVKSLLGLKSADDPAVERVVQRLILEGHLVIDADGAVNKSP